MKAHPVETYFLGLSAAASLSYLEKEENQVISFYGTHLPSLPAVALVPAFARCLLLLATSFMYL